MMSKKILSISLSVLLLGFLISGFILLDKNPHTKTDIKSDINVQQPVPYTTNSAIIYTDNFDAANDTTSLKARGYKVWFRGGGPQGTFATWFQGDPLVFPSFNGPTSGYVAANYQVVTGTNNIDSWLVYPRVSGGLLAGDSLYFYSRSPDGDTFPDSMRVMYSANDSVPEGTWTELGRFKVSIAGWQLKGFRAPAASANGRFAIRYNIVSGGPSGANSDYSGIDAATIVRAAAAPTVYPTAWCPGSTLPVIPSLSAYGASAWLGDTMYTVIGSADGTTISSLVFRFYYGSGWTAGRPLPTGHAQGSMIKCGSKLYYVGGNTATIGGDGSTDIYEYDPTTGWTAKAPMPTNKSGHTIHNYGDSVVFVAGGNWGTQNSIVYAYRPASNTWITSTPFSGPLRRSHAGGMSGNKIFISGGFPFQNDLWIGTVGADASTITWAAGPNFPSVPKSRLGGFAFNDKFYITGGNNSVGTTSADSTFVYSISGNSWSNINSLMPAQLHNISNCVTGRTFNDSLKIYVTGGSSGATTTTNGFFVLSISCANPLAITNYNQIIPGVYSLQQNYPNPFNPTTNIKFAIPKSGNVKLVVFDILGREVKTLVNQFKTAGNYVVDFDASNLSSGVYFYRIESGDFTQVRKMLLVK